MDTSKQMPDLTGEARAHRLAGDERSRHAGSGRRILAELEHGPAAQPRHAAQSRRRRICIDGWTAGLCVLLAVMCTVAWLMHEQALTPHTFKRQPRSSAALVGVDSGKQDDNRHARSNTPADGNVQAATIVTAAPAAAATIVTSASAPRAASPPGTPAMTPARAAGSTENTRDTMSSAGKVGGKATGAARRLAVAGPPAIMDPDVALLTALVAHGGQPGSTTPERSREVVMRADGDHTAALLARCRQLGLIEGLLCRSRICAGSWESDPACRAPVN